MYKQIPPQPQFVSRELKSFFMRYLENKSLLPAARYGSRCTYTI